MKYVTNCCSIRIPYRRHPSEGKREWGWSTRSSPGTGTRSAGCSLFTTEHIIPSLADPFTPCIGTYPDPAFRSRSAFWIGIWLWIPKFKMPIFFYLGGGDPGIIFNLTNLLLLKNKIGVKKTICKMVHLYFSKIISFNPWIWLAIPGVQISPKIWRNTELKHLQKCSSLAFLSYEKHVAQFSKWKHSAIYSPMIYTAPCVMLLMRPASITRASGRGLGPGNRDFLGPVKRHRADRRVPFGMFTKEGLRVQRWNSWTAFYTRFLGISSSLLRFEFWYGFLPSFFRSKKNSSRVDSSFLVSQIFF